MLQNQKVNGTYTSKVSFSTPATAVSTSVHKVLVSSILFGVTPVNVTPSAKSITAVLIFDGVPSAFVNPES